MILINSGEELSDFDFGGRSISGIDLYLNSNQFFSEVNHPQNGSYLCMNMGALAYTHAVRPSNYKDCVESYKYKDKDNIWTVINDFWLVEVGQSYARRPLIKRPQPVMLDYP